MKVVKTKRSMEEVKEIEKKNMQTKSLKHKI
jgi:hypothetical protein